MEEIYGSLPAKEVPSNKTIRDIWMLSSGAPTIFKLAEVEVGVARARQSELVSHSSGSHVTLTS
jgi:hypothetical protein